MKNNLRMLGLAFCMLPMCLHAGTGEDLKQTYQGAESIPAGTILPVTLNSTLRSDRSAQRGDDDPNPHAGHPAARGKNSAQRVQGYGPCGRNRYFWKGI